MTTIRISNKLVSRIEYIIIRKTHYMLERAMESKKPDGAWGQRICDILFADVRPIVQQLPNGWVKNVDMVKITSVGSIVCNLYFELTTPQPWPCMKVENELAIINASYMQDIQLKDHLVWGEFFAEAAAYKEHVGAVKTRVDEFIRAVKKVCSAHTTLASALKTWPPLWELLPEDVKEKHLETTEDNNKKGKKKVVLDVDFDRLTAMSTAIKLGL